VAEKKIASTLLETKYFGLVIGLLVFLLLFALSRGTVLVTNIEQKLLDANFRLKSAVTRTQVQQGVSVVQSNPRISPDILIVGIDDKTLSRLGKWPFPRYRHADLINAFARIKNQSERERALFIDVFFIEPSEKPEDDALLLSSVHASGRVFLETVLTGEENNSDSRDEFFGRQDILDQRIGTVGKVKGNWLQINQFFGVQSPLKTYARATYGFGHANFLPEKDRIYRKQPLIARLSELESEMPLDKLTVDEPIDRAHFEHLAWIDKTDGMHEVPYPLTSAGLAEVRKQMARYAPPVGQDTNNSNAKSFVVRKYRDLLLPSITLSLALEYMHKKLSDVEVVLGQYIRIPAPEKYNVDTQAWEPYTMLVTPPIYDKDGNVKKPGVFRNVSELRIPIDSTGSLLINFMGEPSNPNPEEHQTFPVRPYAGYASNPPPPDPERWPPTKKVGNTVLMVGPFAEGIGDQKPTPFGLMFGVEMHANALNTILMGNFLYYAPPWLNTLILFAMVMLVSLMVSRLSTLWSVVVMLGAIVAYAIVFMFMFEFNNYILTFSAPAAGAVLSLIGVVAYRIVFAEKDNRRISEIFGKFVSPDVRDELLASGEMPELGGVDKELTVFFSDIRGFTTLSESMAPQELVNHLNLYLTALTDLIMEYKGTLDKYVGDEIMCFWGAPIPQEDHALLACKCALKQMEVLTKMNAAWPKERNLNIGIGLNTGIMTIGNMGSAGRMNYTLMGDNVNLGARLEGTNKQYMTNVIISESTYAQVRDKVVARELDIIRVKGKNKPTPIFELIDVIGGFDPPPKVDGKGRAGAKA
jgi:adenylate cyclase